MNYLYLSNMSINFMYFKTLIVLFISLLVVIISCDRKSDHPTSHDQETTKAKLHYETTGSIEFVHPDLHQIISKDALIEVISEGFQWTEGPLWVKAGNYLLFSEIPSNSIYKWSEEEGTHLYLRPSGYTGKQERGGEPGSNGLLLNNKGELVLCQHGDRRIAKMSSSLSAPSPSFVTLIDRFNDQRFNSPNDAVYDSKGNLYFTDPPYGLEGNADDPFKEIPFQGVFRLNSDGTVVLIADHVYRPNGIGLSPDERTLYVASSEGAPMWTKFHLDEEGLPIQHEVFYHEDNPPGKGAPDGLVVDRSGNIWATGPGGVWIFSPEAKILGKILTGEATSNCTFDDKEAVLYMTCDDLVMRVRLRS